MQQALKDSCQPKVKEDITNALDNSENISPKQHKLIVAYIAAHIIIYRNAQRPGDDATHELKMMQAVIIR